MRMTTNWATLAEKTKIECLQVFMWERKRKTLKWWPSRAREREEKYHRSEKHWGIEETANKQRFADLHWENIEKKVREKRAEAIRLLKKKNCKRKNKNDAKWQSSTQRLQKERQKNNFQNKNRETKQKKSSQKVKAMRFVTEAKR